MSGHKQSVSFTYAAFARELVEAGEYPTISAAVSGEMARAKAVRDRTLLEAEVQRRLALPADQRELDAPLESFTSKARAHLLALKG